MVITGLTRKRLTIVTLIYPQTLETLYFFGILSAEISEVGRQFSIKIPNQKFNTERYRSGHNGADSKSVCAQAHEGSNPSLSAKKKTLTKWLVFFFLLCKGKGGDLN